MTTIIYLDIGGDFIPEFRMDLEGDGGRFLFNRN